MQPNERMKISTLSALSGVMPSTIRYYTRKGLLPPPIKSGRTVAYFYIFFKNKDEIFIDCAERLFFDLYEDVWQEVRDEPNMLLRLRKRAWSFLVTYPRWADAMNLLRGVSVSPNQAFGDKYRQIMRQITTPLVREIQKAVEQGVIRPVNPILVAHILLGVADYCGYLHQLGRFNEIELFDAINSFLLHGLQRRETR